MSKEEIIEKCKIKKKPLELLHTIAFNIELMGITCFGDEFREIEQSLQRLEAIGNANSSEALELVGYLKDYFLNMIPYCDWLDDIEKYILKAQEQEKVIIELCEYCGMDNLYPYNNLEEIEITFKDTFDNYQRQRIDSLGRLNKQEKVLKIIKEKRVNIEYLRQSYNVREYNSKITIVIDGIKYAKSEARKLTQEEFNLLKRYFK